MTTPQEYMGKVQVLDLFRAEFGLSRHLIEKRMVELKAKGLIHEYPDPNDGRKLRIPMEDVDIIRRALRGEAV